MSVRPALRRPLAALAVAATGLAPLVLAPPATASPGGDQVVISEVYASGGSSNSSSAFQRDFVELSNPTSSPIDLGGTSLQYRPATNSSTPTLIQPLSGTVPAKGTFLVNEGNAGTGGEVNPEGDLSGSLNLAAGGGTIVLAAQTAGVPIGTGSVTADPRVLDLVGWGTSNTYEGTVAPAAGAATTLSRSATGGDTDVNATDLTVGAPSPTRSGSTPPTDPPTDPPVRDVTIEQIQGTGATSPIAGDTVRTEGVVTAAYPTGGFNGFYVQTAGTGGDIDPATHEGSDAVFVYGSAATAVVEVGDHVRVTGEVTEYQGTTELTPAGPSDVSVLGTPAEAVTPAQVAYPRTESGRESFEGMLLAPQGPYTVADNYTLNNYGEIGVASGTTPLYTPTEVAAPRDSAAIAAVNADNAARLVVLDDGASLNFLGAAEDTPLPYLTKERQIRVGAPVTFTAPVVLEYRFSAWRFQPTSQVSAEDSGPAVFGHTRTEAPQPTGGDVHLASFNVLNYFPTTGEEYVASGGTCTFYTDRADDPVTDRDCGPTGPRGAAEEEDLQRQQAKIVTAINKLGADVVSLEEIENSARFGQDRDAAVGTLVAALNAAAGPGTWSFVPTPASAGDQSDEDVIRTAFIYKPTSIRPVGDSVIDDVPVFDVARDPLAQAFERVGGGAASRFTVIVNHFKSKGSGPDDGTGQGNSNPQRVQQSLELRSFARDMVTHFGTEAVFLSGDFNAYTQEDPMAELYRAGYTDLGSAKAPGEHTYLFGGTVGSLDHVLANDAALALVTGAHVWNINSVESLALEYSRDNYNATDFYAPDAVPCLRPRPARGRAGPAARSRRSRGDDRPGPGHPAPGRVQARPPGRAGSRPLRRRARPGRGRGWRHGRGRGGARGSARRRSGHHPSRRRPDHPAGVEQEGVARARGALPRHRPGRTVRDHGDVRGGEEQEAALSQARWSSPSEPGSAGSTGGGLHSDPSCQKS